ncbi:hypothetical protein C6P52_14995 [Enterococcus mundtii]|nr:hypothetical protein C6P52_14995 [Enterococcus mundtii]
MDLKKLHEQFIHGNFEIISDTQLENTIGGSYAKNPNPNISHPGWHVFTTANQLINHLLGD